MDKPTLRFNPDLASLYLKAVFCFCVGGAMFIRGLNELISGKAEQVWFLIIWLLLASFYPLTLLKLYRIPKEQRNLYLRKVRYSGSKSYKIHPAISICVLGALCVFYIWTIFH